MTRTIGIALYVLAMAALIVGMDVAFFQGRFWERLIVNIAVVAAFAAIYWRYLKGP